MHVQARFSAILAEAIGRSAAAPDADDLDEVVIKGEERLGAG